MSLLYIKQIAGCLLKLSPPTGLEVQRHDVHQQHASVRRKGGLQRRRGRAVLQLHLLQHGDNRDEGWLCPRFRRLKPEIHRKCATKFPTVRKERMRIIARLIWLPAFFCVLLAYTLLLKVREQEIIVNYDGQESGDYEEEENGGTFGNWDFW